MNKIPRNSSFKNRIGLAYSYKCALSGMDEIQCEAAHIIPYSENDTEANGMLLSVELHRLYDKFIWCPNPNTQRNCSYKKGFTKYDISISDKYKDKILTINKYKFSQIEIKNWSHNFIVKAYDEYRKKNYPEEYDIQKSEEKDLKVICENCGKECKKSGLKRHQNVCLRKDN